MKVPACISLVFLSLVSLVACASSPGVDEAAARHAAAHRCALAENKLCAFENAHTALSNPDYLASLRRDDVHVHLAEWDWYAGYAFDAAEVSPPSDKRRIAELAIATLTRHSGKSRTLATTALHVLRAEACIALADYECARNSARFVAGRQKEADGSGQAQLGNWYIPHSRDAPGVDDFRQRLKAVIKRSQ